MKQSLKVLVVLSFFAVALSAPSFASAMKSPTTLVYRLSQHISLTVQTSLSDENELAIDLVLHDDRAGGPKNFQIGRPAVDAGSGIEKIELPKPDFITQGADASIELQEAGDLIRNLKREGNFVFHVHVATMKGPRSAFFLFPLKRILRSLEESYYSFKTSDIPLETGSQRYVSVRKLTNQSPYWLFSIVDVAPDGGYQYLNLLVGNSPDIYVLDGPYLDLYSMPNQWLERRERVFLGGTEVYYPSERIPAKLLRSYHFQPGQARFPGFSYSVGSLGTRNFIQGLDAIKSPPFAKGRQNQGIALRTPGRAGDPEPVSEEAPKTFVEEGLAGPTAALEHLMTRLAPEKDPVIDSQAASIYVDLMDRVNPPRSCQDLFSN